MPIGNIWSGISFRHDNSIFVALAEPCCLVNGYFLGEDLHHLGVGPRGGAPQPVLGQLRILRKAKNIMIKIAVGETIEDIYYCCKRLIGEVV